MRGKVFVGCQIFFLSRITPAYAGKRVASTFSLLIVKGSPPPMRGKDHVFSPVLVRARITPAYAGKRLYKLHTIFLYRDHPRLCGEKRTAGRLENQYSGSPPPMRGKGVAADTMIDVTRITPAYAGKRIDACDALSVQ